MGIVVEVSRGRGQKPYLCRLDDHNRRWATCRKVHVCRTCGRRIPVGAKCVLRKWYRGSHPGWIRECAECSDAMLACRKLHDALDWKAEAPVREACRVCDDYPVCPLIANVRGSEPGDVAWEMLDLEVGADGSACA